MKVLSAKAIERKWEEEDWDFLRSHYKKKLEKDPRNSFLLHDLAVIQMESGHYSESYNYAGALSYDLFW